MNRRAAVTAAVVVSAFVFVIRVAIVYLKKEAAPPSNPVVVDRSRSTPVTAPSPFTLRSEAKGKLRMLATEARQANAIKTATAAYDADAALDKDDCAAAKSAMTRAAEGIPPDSPVKPTLESTSRSVDAYCETTAR